MAETRKIVRPVRIHQRIDLRQLIARLMMIDHHHRHAEPPRLGERLKTGGAAIDGHQQGGALAGQRADGLGIGAVAFENPVGNMNQRIEPAMAQVPGQKGCRGGAIDVVVAEDRDLLAARGGVRDALGGGLHLGHGVGIGHQFADGGIEKILDRVDLDIAPRQHPRQHFRQLVALGDRERPRRPPRIEPVAPHLAGGGARHAEERWPYFNGNGGCGKRHDACSR